MTTKTKQIRHRSKFGKKKRIIVCLCPEIYFYLQKLKNKNNCSTAHLFETAIIEKWGKPDPNEYSAALAAAMYTTPEVPPAPEDL